MVRSSPAEAVEENNDLLVEILLRLPAKLVLDFKCVSKRWLSLISSRYFCQRHTLHHSNTKVFGIFLRTYDEIELISFSTNHASRSPFNSYRKILHSCNGLLLYSCKTKRPYSYSYFICNPTTKHILPLPHPISAVDDLKRLPDDTPTGVNVLTGVKDMILAFDPSHSPNYTVVCAILLFHVVLHQQSRVQIMVYSSEAERRGWRPCGSTFIFPHSNFGNGVFWNGAVHWICLNKNAFLCFDVSRECLKLRNNMPPIPDCTQDFSLNIVVAGGHLHLVGFRIPYTISLYRLEEDYSRWVPMYNFDGKQVGVQFPETVCPLHLLQGDSEQDLSLLMRITSNKVIALRFNDGKFYKICDSMSPDDKHFPRLEWSNAHDYIESLACV